MKDGGPAFPTSRIEPASEAMQAIGTYTIDVEYPGMSLRDWFAGRALATLDVQAHVSHPAADALAKSAYEIADAMLQARIKGEE